jgi:serine/threonine protein kinase
MMQARGTGLEPSSAIRVLRDTARGMDFLHKRGIVHRDLKAANLLIDEHDVSEARCFWFLLSPLLEGFDSLHTFGFC